MHVAPNTQALLLSNRERRRAKPKRALRVKAMGRRNIRAMNWRCLNVVVLCTILALTLLPVEVIGIGGIRNSGGWMRGDGRLVGLRGGGANGYGSSGKGGDERKRESSAKTRQREQLYDAYNMLHSLAQEFRKPFDSPAVLVVGHQTSGKSALVEALMGFQFNQVGGGTKTRRPIALRMQYNPECDTPRCHLTLENGREEPRSLAQIQSYIESENRRIERDPMRSFDSREIVIRMEYRFCPNMILIDTPGLIQAPSGRHLNPQQRHLLQDASESESLVKQKMRCQDYIILCVEDTTDWKHSPTRNVVMQVDPALERTVLVSTKLDTKLPQFSDPGDLEDYLAAPEAQRMHGTMLGGPFFTSVPSGRVGRTDGSVYFSNEAFVQSVRRAERQDCQYVGAKLGPQGTSRCLNRVGLSKLRTFLERRVEDCYRRNVARIVPLLQRELNKAEMNLLATEEDLRALSVEQLKESAEEYREHFVGALRNAIQGTIRAPPETFGESLEAEQLKAGSFLSSVRPTDAIEATDPDPRMDRLMELEVGNTEHRLFGGGQYHRCLREFSFAVQHMPSPEVTEDEIANAAGMGDMHDGVNFMRAACVIAVEKARLSFDPMLDSLRARTSHVMKRLSGIVDYILQLDGLKMSEDHQKPFSFVVRRIYENFVDRSAEDTMLRCRDDLFALTRFVTWDLTERSSGALQRSLPDTSMVQVYAMAVENSRRRRCADESPYMGSNHPQSSGTRGRRTVKPSSWTGRGNNNQKQGYQWDEFHNNRSPDNERYYDVPFDAAGGEPSDVSILGQWEAANTEGVGGSGSGATTQRDCYNLLQLMEEASSSRDAKRTHAVIAALVRHIMASWRTHFARTVAMKFNCFFMMPFSDRFPSYLRQELDKVYQGDVGELFDIAEARAALYKRREGLIAECKACHSIQEKFDLINTQLNAARLIYGEEVSDDEPPKPNERCEMKEYENLEEMPGTEMKDTAWYNEANDAREQRDQNQGASFSSIQHGGGDGDKNGFDLGDQYVGLPESQKDVFLCARAGANSEERTN